VQISHLKLAMRSLWGRADSLLGVLDAARQEGIEITADVYPYTYWQSTLTVLFPERNYRDRSAAEFALREVAAPGGLLLGRFAPNSTYVGRTLADIARQRRTDPATTLMGLIAEAEAFKAAQPAVEDVESVIGISMDERDVERLLAWPYANICTDGELAGRHPRGFGAFPKVLGVYARQRRAFSTAEAVRKMTSLPARNMGIRDRGVVRAGGFADLVLFDTLACWTMRPRPNRSGPRAGSAGSGSTDRWSTRMARSPGGTRGARSAGGRLRRRTDRGPPGADSQTSPAQEAVSPYPAAGHHPAGETAAGRRGSGQSRPDRDRQPG
jgi:N-acyl-D-amino-acid deacylase